MGIRDDVLDLTEKVNDDGSVTNLSRRDPEPPPMREPGPVFSFDDGDMGGGKGGSSSFDDDEDYGGLLSKNSASASANAFAQLDSLNEPEPIPEPPVQRSSNGSLTVEDLVRESLAPVLKDWLDRNLPPIVEELVRAEIQRVAGGRRR